MNKDIKQKFDKILTSKVEEEEYNFRWSNLREEVKSKGYNWSTAQYLEDLRWEYFRKGILSFSTTSNGQSDKMDFMTITDYGIKYFKDPYPISDWMYRAKNQLLLYKNRLFINIKNNWKIYLIFLGTVVIGLASFLHDCFGLLQYFGKQ